MSKHTTHTSKPYEIKPFGLNPDVIVCIENKDLQRYRYLVNQVKPDEVQWYAKVERVVVPVERRSRSHHRPLYAYYISDMFIPEQEVSSGSVDTDVRKNPMVMYRLMQEIEGRYPDPDSELGFDVDKVNEDMQAMHCWCHSHPFTGNPSPSGTDDRQFEDWIKENQMAQGLDTPMVALIFGAGEKIHARLYDPRVPDIMYDNVEVHIDYEEDFDTDYMDMAVATKITKKQWGHGTQIRCSDGVWRSQAGKKAFDERQAKKEEQEDPEAKAAAFFAKNFPKDWDDWLKVFNKKYDNDQEVIELWTFCGRYLQTMEERTIFTFALTDSPESLRQLAKGNQDDLFLLNNEDALICLVGHFASDTLSSVQLKAAIQLAKRYCKQKDEAGRLRAVGAWEKTMEGVPHQTTVWEKTESSQSAQAEVQNAGSEGYGFVADEDDNTPPWDTQEKNL